MGIQATVIPTQGLLPDEVTLTKVSATTIGLKSGGITDTYVASNANILATKIKSQYQLTSDILWSHNTVASTSSTTATKLKTITIISLSPSPTTIRIYFELRSTGLHNAYGQIYKNGSAYGTLRSTASSSFVGYTEDLTFSQGDTIELWVYADSGETAYVQNFRVLGKDISATGQTSFSNS